MILQIESSVKAKKYSLGSIIIHKVPILCPILNCSGSTKKKTKFKPRRSLCSDSRTQHSKIKRYKNRALDPNELIISFCILGTPT